eukprot:TRINITY_DN1980_c0_g1_i5.p1 TRINITY_DN1980_c0_g1~~TRINITY_DN1980_c0_g1_i5.p1  ORF type:complete len:189 (-),score=57.41 TRINITY_DN1980_c0_g1_i5:86-652(-)
MCIRDRVSTQSTWVFKTNVFSTINFTEKMIAADVIRKNGKIVLLGSMLGNLSGLKNEELKKKFLDEKIKTQDLINLANMFRSGIEKQTFEKDGWPQGSIYTIYSVTKMIINIYPRVLAQFKEIKERNIGVYSCHPGWVKTDMGGPQAPQSIEEGVVTPIFVIELPDGIHPEYQAKYFDGCKVAPFCSK